MNIKLSRKEILKLASNADVYRRGHKDYQERRLSSVEYIENPENSHMTAVGNMTNPQGKAYTVKAEFDATGALISHSCPCDAHLLWKGACQHVVTLLLHVSQEVEERERRFRENRYAEEIVAAFDQKISQAVEQSLGRPDLESGFGLHPHFVLNEEQIPAISLTVGKTRKYTIRDIDAFLNDIAFENYCTYGKDLSFKHTLETFDSKSRRLIELLQKMNRRLADMQKESGVYFSPLSGKTALLTREDLDAFFDIYNGNKIKSNIYGMIADTLLLTDSRPETGFHLMVDWQEQAVTLSGGPGVHYRLLNGYSYSYFILDSTLYRMDTNTLNAFISLTENINISEDKQVIFKDHLYHRFFSTIYPELIKMGMVNPTGIDAPAVFPLKTNVYLDMEHTDLSAKIVFQYGKIAVPYMPAIETFNSPDNQAEILRDPEGEYRITRLFKIYGFETAPSGEMFLTNEDRIYDFLIAGIEDLKAYAEIYVTDRFTKKSLNATNKVSMNARIEGNLLEINIDAGEYSMLELYEAAMAYTEKKRYFRFKDGSFTDLENMEVKSLAGLIENLALTKQDFNHDSILLPSYRAVTIDSFLGSGLMKFRHESIQALLDSLNEKEGALHQPPDALSSILRKYQQKGFSWLKALSLNGFGGILADDMGLGKTLQMIALLLDEKTGWDSENPKEKQKPSLVVAPTSLIYNWEKEIIRFAPAIKAVVLAGGPARRAALLSEPSDIYITTYDTLKRDIAQYQDMDFRYIIADEAQNIKNPHTQNAKAIKGLKSDNRFALTGTPIENALSELWSIFDFIMPGYLHSYRKFATLFESPIMRDNSSEAAEILKKQISPFILRRLKTDVLKELPEKTETCIYAVLEEEQRKIYTATFLNAKGELDLFGDGAIRQKKLSILSQLTRLRQICCHPATCMEGYRGGSGKLDTTMDTVTRALESGHRVLLFSQFTSMLYIIRNILEQKGISYFYLDGATSSKRRLEMSDKFNQGEKDIFLISLRAGGTGLNLTGADVVIHYDQWWNPAVMAQASDRAHRLGQKRAVQVFNIIAKGTIEEKIMELQERKKLLTENIIEPGDSFLNTLTDEDILEIFTE